MNLRDRLRNAEIQLLSGPHPQRARLDAESLALFLLGENRAWLFSYLDEPFPNALEPSFSQLVARRKQGEPIQYITGETEFFGLPFEVSGDVLVPRPETEHLVEEVLSLASAFPAPRIADIGTGSGAIAVALAHALPTARITATDLFPRALETARRNAERNQVADRITFLEGDLLAPLADECFHILACNPPYISTTDRDSLSVEVRDYEPSSALFAGEDGLDIYRRLIPVARHHLVPGGWLVLEIGFGQQPAIEELLKAFWYQEINFIADYQGILRVAAAQVP